MAIVTGNLPPKASGDKTTDYFNNFFNDSIGTSQNIDDAVVGFFQQLTGDKDAGRTLAATILYTALNQNIDPMALIDEIKRLNNGQKLEVKTKIDGAVVADQYNTLEELESYWTGDLPVITYKTANQVTETLQLTATSTEGFNLTGTIDNAINTFTIAGDKKTYYAGETATLVEGESFVLGAFQLNINGGYTFTPRFILDNYKNGQLFYTAGTKTFYRKKNNKIINQAGFVTISAPTTTGEMGNTYYSVSHKTQTNELNAYLTMFLNLNRVNTSLLGLTNSPQPNKYVARAILP